MSRHKKRRATQTRDAPGQGQKRSSAVMLCDTEAWKELLGSRYRPLMECPEVQMCIGVYADLIANMTIHLMQNTAGGDKRIKDGLSAQLDITPCEWTTHQGFVSTIVRVMLSTGNQITLPEYSPEGMLQNLLPVPPSKVNIMDRPEGGYRVRIGERMIEPDELLHFAVNPDPERPWVGRGYSVQLGDVVKSLRQANDTKLALMERPNPSLIVRVDSYTDEMQTVEGQQAIADRYLSNNRGGRPLVIPAETFEVQQVKAATLTDLAIDKNLELDKKTVAAIFGVPPFLVGVGEFKAEQYDWFVSTRVMAVARIIEQELTKKLLYAPDRYFRFNRLSLLNYNIKRMVEVSAELLDRLTMSRNEARDWIGLEPREDMEELLALENYVPATMLGKQKKLVQKGGGEEDAQ